jgi:AcrR family transcriptional regulator
VAVARRPRTETQAETRRHLLDAAERLFEEQGFHRTSVGEIAKAAGYTTGAIYSNFERKEDLAVAVLGRSIGRNQAALEEALAVRGDLAARLLSVIRWRAAYFPDADPLGILRLELLLLASRDPRLRADLVAWQRQLHEALVQLLDEQAADLGVTYLVDTELLAAALLGSADGTAMAHSVDPAGPHQRAYAWTLASLMVNSMDPRPVAPEAWPAFADALVQAAADAAQAPPSASR